MAYLVQIVGQPRQIISLKVGHPSFVLLPTKYAADLIVKRGGRRVEAAELIQGIVGTQGDTLGWSHE